MGTRLIERFRVLAPAGGTPARLAMPLMGLGVFAMTRRHMLGLKERAERSADRASLVRQAAIGDPVAERAPATVVGTSPGPARDGEGTRGPSPADI